jgi:hypothetical protein
METNTKNLDNSLCSRIEGMFRTQDRELWKLAQKWCHKYRLNYYYVYERQIEMISPTSQPRRLTDFRFKTYKIPLQYSLYKMKVNNHYIQMRNPQLHVKRPIEVHPVVFKIVLDGTNRKNRRPVQQSRHRE